MTDDNLIFNIVLGIIIAALVITFWPLALGLVGVVLAIMAAKSLYYDFMEWARTWTLGDVIASVIFIGLVIAFFVYRAELLGLIK